MAKAKKIVPRKTYQCAAAAARSARGASLGSLVGRSGNSGEAGCGLEGGRGLSDGSFERRSGDEVGREGSALGGKGADSAAVGGDGGSHGCCVHGGRNGSGSTAGLGRGGISAGSGAGLGSGRGRRGCSFTSSIQSGRSTLAVVAAPLNNLVGNISTASLGRAVTKAVVEVGILAQARVVIVRASKLGVLAGHVGDAKVLYGVVSIIAMK